MNLDSLDAMRRYLDKASAVMDHTNPLLEEEYEIARGLYHFKTKNYAAAESLTFARFRSIPLPRPCP